MIKFLYNRLLEEKFLEKVAEIYEEAFYDCNLYLNDIEEILNIFKEVNGSGIELIVNSYKLNDLDEIKNDKFSEITKLQISMHNPYITFNYSNNRIILFSINNSTLNIGACEKIKSIINKRKSKYYAISKKIIPGIIGGISGFIIGPLIFEVFINKAVNQTRIMNYTKFLAIYLIFSFIYFKFFNKIKTNIFNSNFTKENFFSRNKEKIILLAIGSLITMVMQLLLKIFQSIFS